ncbi:Gfo/Idh/MocA family oxidoreductase [Rhodococcus olei]|uniref:Gfo/Idh/MocA family oxidoreductase n=1 Tax=Rhodococcus olei TaxID=2161675 RepID=A0ABP8PPK3_9NOCA
MTDAQDSRPAARPGPSRPLGLAVIGTGFGCITHVPAFRDAGFEVRALIGRDRARTVERAERFGIPHAATSLAEALAATDVDAVTIATPPHTHADLAIEAVSRGLHVVCEKPFAADLSQARKMLEAAERAGVVHQVGTEFRYGTPQALLAREIAAGAIGTPKLATLLLHLPMFAADGAEAPDWWTDGTAGGGWLGAQGTHMIDQIRCTLGEFETVSAGLPVVADRGQTAEDSFTVHFRTVTGVDGVLQSTVGAWGPLMMTTRIAGTTGTLWLEGDRVRRADAAGEHDVPVPDDLANPAPVPPPFDFFATTYDWLHATGIDRAPYARLADVFRRRILGEEIGPHEPRPATFADGVAGQAVLDAIRLSAAEGRSVRPADLA